MDWKCIFIFGAIVSILIRIPHDRISQAAKVVENRKGLLEKTLLFLVLTGMVILPVLSFFTPLLEFAAYAPNPMMVAIGSVALLASLWVFHRSHKDLGRNWSASLEIREHHILVTNGIYNPFVTRCTPRFFCWRSHRCS